MTTTDPTDDLGIRCPKCGARNEIDDHLLCKDTIALGQNQSIQRVRVCPYCGKRFNTFERAATRYSGSITPAE